MLEKKPTFNKKKSFFRSSTMMTVNENSIEKISLEDYRNEYKFRKNNLS